MTSTSIVELQVHLVSGETIKFGLAGSESHEPADLLKQFVEDVEGEAWVNINQASPATAVPVSAIAYVTASRAQYGTA